VWKNLIIMLTAIAKASSARIQIRKKNYNNNNKLANIAQVLSISWFRDSSNHNLKVADGYGIVVVVTSQCCSCRN